jgi:hypothetical protein
MFVCTRHLVPYRSSTCTRSRRGIRGGVLSLALLLLALLLPQSARASDGTDFAIDVLAAALAQPPIGVYVGSTEKAILKSIVSDVEQGTPFPEALKNAVISPLVKSLPKEVQDLAKCLTGTSDIAGCAQNELIKRLPPPAQEIAQCALRNPANSGRCVQQQLISQLPSDAQGMAKCIVDGKPVDQCTREELIKNLPKDAQGVAECLARVRNAVDVAGCASGEVQQALRRLEDTAVNTARDRFFKPQPSLLQNVVNIVIGIKDNDWQKVAENGGATIAKAVVRVVLTAFPVTQPFMGIIGPLVDVMIENRIDLAVDLVRAAQDGDAPAFAQIVIEAYYALQLEGVCSLPVIPQSIRETFCGPLAAIIHEVGKAAAGIVNQAIGFIEQAVKNPLGIPEQVMTLPVKVAEGVFEWFGDRIEDVRREAADLKEDCGTAERYYASRFAQCLPAAAQKKLSDPAGFARFEAELYQQCRDAFGRCFFSVSFSQICDPMRRLFNEQTQKLDTGLRDAAAIYSREINHFVESRLADACECGVLKPDFMDYAYSQFIGECGADLGKQMPLDQVNDTQVPARTMGNGGFAPNCVPGPGQIPNFSSPRVGATACRAAVTLAKFKDAAGDVCKANFNRNANLYAGCARTPSREVIELIVGKPIPPSITTLKDPINLRPPPNPFAAGAPIPSPGRSPDRVFAPNADPGRLFDPAAGLAGGTCVGGNMVGGDCRCPPGESPRRFTDRTVCVPAEQAKIPIPDPSSSNVPVPSTRSPGTVVIPAGCSGGRLGTPPNCYCPSGTQWTGRACLNFAIQPPVDRCPPGLTSIQGRCVQLGGPQPVDPFSNSGVLGGGGRRPPIPPAAQTCPPDRPVGTFPNCCPPYTVSDGRGGCGGSDTVQKGGVSVPPPGAKIPVPSSTTSQNVLTRGGGGAAGAIRANPCQSWQVLRNGVCACPIGMTGSRCEQVLVR